MELKRETFTSKGFTEAEVTELLDSIYKSSEDAKKYQKELNDANAKLVGYSEMKAKLDALETEKMTETEKLNAREKAIQERETALSEKEKQTNITLNQAKVKVMLAEIGIDDEKTISNLVTDDETSSIENATNFVNLFKAKIDEAQKNAIAGLQQKDIKPNGSNVKQDDGTETVITSKAQFNDLLMKNYEQAKQWKDSNLDLYEKLK